MAVERNTGVRKVRYKNDPSEPTNLSILENNTDILEGKYGMKVLEYLGRGSFGQVWKAIWREEVVAIKFQTQTELTSGLKEAALMGLHLLVWTLLLILFPSVLFVIQI